jgi:hypothetical protein
MRRVFWLPPARVRLWPALLVILALSAWLPRAAWPAAPVKLYINGVVAGSYPLVREGVAYLPIHALAQGLGVAISWDSRLNIVKVNEQVVAATPLPVDGKIYLPIEAIVQALGGSAVWDGRTGSIHIKTGAALAGSSGTTPGTSTVSVPASPPSPTWTPAPPAPSSSPAVTTVAATTPGFPTGSPPPEYPSPSAYPPSTGSSTAASVRPVDAPPSMPANLSLPPVSQPEESSRTGQPSGVTGYQPLPSNAQVPTSEGVYVPRSAQNSVFQVTVTKVETVGVIKDFYRPRTGYKFIIVYLSQQNISEEVQIYTGRFSLLDQRNHSYDPIEGLSNFWLVILRPYGINFGYLVYEVPADARPMSLVLHALNQAPLSLNL